MFTVLMAVVVVMVSLVVFMDILVFLVMMGVVTHLVCSGF